jgi:succinoglycan biosynthesis protein ExoM
LLRRITAPRLKPAAMQDDPRTGGSAREEPAARMSAHPDISICIASYRRPTGLARLLESLHRQKVPPELSYEILVVDNDPAAPPEPLPGVRVLHEPRRNIAHARNRAVEAARGTWIAFIDDDEEACEGWLAAYWRLAERREADGFFGPVLPRLAPRPGAWLAAEAFYARARHPSGTPIGRSEVRTSNAFLRRSLFRDRRFDPAYGRSGGSDTELFTRMLDAGARLLFCDDARVVETVPAERQRLVWLTRRAFRGGAVSTRIERARRPHRARQALARATCAFALFGALLPISVLGGRVAATRVWLRLCVQAGHLWSAVGGGFEEYA